MAGVGAIVNHNNQGVVYAFLDRVFNRFGHKSKYSSTTYKIPWRVPKVVWEDTY
jgi:hypothetical protein